MMFRNLAYSIKEAFKNLWRNNLMSIASITSVLAALLILGAVFVIIININSFVDGAQEEFQEITAYLVEGIDTESKEIIIDQISNIIGVDEVKYVSKEEAFENWRTEWGENSYLLDGLDENPLPDSIIIKLKKLENSDSIVDIINNYDGIEDVRFRKDIIDSIINISNFVRTIGFGLIVILLAISTFIITNTIKLAVYARKREINIMKYIGATNWFIRRPFLIEGTILGLIGALISLAVIYVAYSYMYNYFTTEFYMMFANHFIPAESVINSLAIIFIVLGMGIGALGSINAMRKHLNV